MAVLHPPGMHRSRDASILDPSARAAAFTALHPVLERLVHEAGTDTRLTPEALRVLRAVTGTKPGHGLALSDLATRSSTPKTRVLTALQQLQTHVSTPSEYCPLTTGRIQQQFMEWDAEAGSPLQGADERGLFEVICQRK